MREQKYANILEKTEEEIEEVRNNVESEEVLSMTRELKFKELQDSIDDNLANEDLSDSLDDSTISNIEEDVILDDVLAKSEEAVDKKKENEDIYLTASFKPLKNRFRLKKVFKVLLSFIFIITFIVVFGFFVVLPIYNKYLESRPKVIFNTIVDYAFNNVISLVNDNYINGSFNSDVNLKINTDMDFFNKMNNYNLGLKYGINYNKDINETNIYLVGKDYNISIIQGKDKRYFEYGNSNEFLEESNLDSKTLNNYLNTNYFLSKSDLLYVLEKNKELIKLFIIDEQLTTSRDELLINDKNIEVVKNTLELDSDIVRNSLKKYSEALLSDSKYIEIIAKILETSVFKIENELKKIDSIVSKDLKLDINVYTMNGNKVVGFDIEENGFTNYYVYFYNGKFDVHLNFSRINECRNDSTCNNKQFVVDLKGVKDNNSYNVELLYNDKKIGKFKVNSFNLNKIDVDFNVEDKDITSNLLLTLDSSNKKYVLDVNGRIKEKYFDTNLVISLKADNNIGYVDQNNIVPYIDNSYIEYIELLKKDYENVNSVEVFELWYSFIAAPIKFINNVYR